MKKILITGASGFVGSHTVRQAVTLGYEVHALVREDSSRERITDVEEKISIHTGALEDREFIHSLVKQLRPRAVLHLATSPIMSGKTADASTLIRTNIEGTVNLMDAAQASGVGAFINLGSGVGEYGPKNHPVAEDERCEPVELYAVTKLAGTLYGQGLAQRTGFPCLTFRLFTPYGPGIQKGRLLYNLIEHTLKGTPVQMGAPTVSRDFIFAEDIPPLLLEALERAEEKKGEIYNLGSGESTTLQSLVETVFRASDMKTEVEWNKLPVLSYDSEFWQADMTKTFKAFSWRPKISLLKGVTRTVEWMRTRDA